jgi:hypothetical protein
LEISHIGPDQRVIVICVKFSDLPRTRLRRAQDWVNLLNRQVRRFCDQATFGKTTFSFEGVSGGPADGWFQLPYRSDRGFYVDTGGAQDSITLADRYIDFSSYNRVLIIDNSLSNWGQGSTYFMPFTVSSGGEFSMMEDGRMVRKRYMTACIVHEGQSGGGTFDLAAFTAAHEMGHNLVCKGHYGNITISGQVRESITPWTVMGYLLETPPTHHLGWSKYERGWLVNEAENRSRVRTIGPPTTGGFDERVTLKPQEILYQRGVQLILVPFRADPPFIGYVIENRARLNGDEAIPQTGIVLSIISEYNPWLPHENIIVLTNPRFPGNINELPLRVGDSFRDEARNITIRVERRMSNDFEVRVQYPLASDRRPNPIIRPWGAPPWETVDIWFDSPRNEWGTYRYGRDASGNVIGNGDDPWLNHDNRIYARITNRGSGGASNVKVRLYSSQPPAIGDAPDSWSYLGTIIFPFIGSGVPAEDFITWRPTGTSHTCIKAEIEGSPDFIDASLKAAQENIAVFETIKGSPWKSVHLKAQVCNPYSKPISVNLNVSDVPQDWAIQLEPSRLTLPPKGRSDVTLEIFPGGPPDDNEQTSEKYKVGFIAKPKLEAWIPYDDYFVLLGGIEAWVHLVDKSSLKIHEVTVKDRSVIVNGSVTPEQGDLMVAIEIRQGKHENIFYAKTDKEGRFISQFQPPSKGLWTAQAFFDGNDSLASSESEVHKFEA